MNFQKIWKIGAVLAAAVLMLGIAAALSRPEPAETAEAPEPLVLHEPENVLPDAGLSYSAAGGIPEDTRRKYNIGSCKTLEGTPYVLAIFLDDDVSSWPEEKVHDYWDQLLFPGMAFLEENAAKWGVELDFQVGYYATYGHPHRPVKYDGVIKTFQKSGDTSRDILEQAAASLGFGTKEEMHEAIQEYSGQEQVAYVIMLNKGGRSYSIGYHNDPAFTGYDGPLMEYCVIYTGFTDTSGDTGSDCIAHEMLHLFGAEDYYILENRKQLAREIYPKDIMLCAMPDLEYFDLGDFTAYTVGWTDEVPEVCMNEKWWS